MKKVIYMDTYIWTSRIINKITTKEYAEYVLILDAHLLNKFRANAVLPQFQRFYETYGITGKDGIYINPKDRLGIW